MAGPGDREPRTVLEYLVRQLDRTYAELAADFEKLARITGDRATISPRHLARLARGERAGAGAHPTTRRVLQQMFGRSAEELLSPWSPDADPWSTPADDADPGQPTFRVDVEGNVWAQVDRRTVLVGSLAALVAGSKALAKTAEPADDPFGFAGAFGRGWPAVRLSRPVPDYGVDWQLLLPGGRAMPGSVAAAQIHGARSVDGRVEVPVADVPRAADFLGGPGRRVIVGADGTGETPRFFVRHAPDASPPPASGRRKWTIHIPAAYELDDLTYGILWAISNLDDALQSDDQALAEAKQDLAAYERLSASAVSREAAPGLNPIGHMWLGSDFCARHIIRSLPELPTLPAFWTREQRGEEASTWLLFDHKYRYLRKTMELVGSAVERGFCIPEDAVHDSPRHERALLFLAIALMESLGIHAKITTDPDFEKVEGFVVAPAKRAIIANWVRGDGMWHVDLTDRAVTVRGFTEVASDVGAGSVIDGPTAAARLRALANYLALDWAWLTRRCAALAAAGTAGMMRPRSRMLSAAGLDAACAFVGSLPASQ